MIFLDSDNVAIDDVDPLFESPQYQETGAMLWPDYWASSAAPDVREILGLKSLPEGTSESGQMVFDKMRWAFSQAPALCGLSILIKILKSLSLDFQKCSPGYGMHLCWRHTST